jgi:hypothetical protein
MDRICKILAVGTPFDPTFSLVTSPFLSPLVLAILRLALAFYGTMFVVVKLIYEGIKFHTDASYVLVLNNQHVMLLRDN